jgi:hypothetical protein
MNTDVIEEELNEELTEQSPLPPTPERNNLFFLHPLEDTPGTAPEEVSLVTFTINETAAVPAAAAPLPVKDEEAALLPTFAPVVDIIKKQKGRPNIHPFAGRIYLLKKELEAALADKEAFISLMHETYRPSDERKLQLGAELDTPNELSFTVHGEISQVIDQLCKLRDAYGDKAKVSISKERLLNPGNALYLQPIREVIGERKGKKVYRHIFEEFRADCCYGYVVVSL